MVALSSTIPSLVIPPSPRHRECQITSESGLHLASLHQFQAFGLSLPLASTPISLTSVPPIPPAKRKRIRTLHKATLEVKRQERETHDSTDTTSAWRLAVPEMNGPGGVVSEECRCLASSSNKSIRTRSSARVSQPKDAIAKPRPKLPLHPYRLPNPLQHRICRRWKV